jgi:hypothetical protein
MPTKVNEEIHTKEFDADNATVSMSERQMCLRDIAHLRKQCDRMSAPSDSAQDLLACPVRREMYRLMKISGEM